MSSLQRQVLRRDVEHLFPKELDPGGAAGLHLHQGTGGPWVGKRVKKPSHPAHTGLEPPLAMSDICPGETPWGARPGRCRQSEPCLQAGTGVLQDQPALLVGTQAQNHVHTLATATGFYENTLPTAATRAHPSAHTQDSTVSKGLGIHLRQDCRVLGCWKARSLGPEWPKPSLCLQPPWLSASFVF